MLDRAVLVGINDEVVRTVVIVKKSGQRVSLRYFRRCVDRSCEDQGSVGKIEVIIAVPANGEVRIQAEVHRFTRLPCPCDQVKSVLFRVVVTDRLVGGPGWFADSKGKTDGAVRDDLEVERELVGINGFFPDDQWFSFPDCRYLTGAK